MPHHPSSGLPPPPLSSSPPPPPCLCVKCCKFHAAHPQHRVTDLGRLLLTLVKYGECWISARAACLRPQLLAALSTTLIVFHTFRCYPGHMDIFLSILEPHLIFTLTHHICAILTRAANLVISNRFWQMDKRLSPPKVRKPFGCLSSDVPPPKAEKLACDCVRARSERCSSAASSGDQGLRGFAAAKMAGTGPELYLR